MLRMPKMKVLTGICPCPSPPSLLRSFGATDFHRWPAETKLGSEASERSLERETGIEPATNSLEGCDSTTELLPPIPMVIHAIGKLVSS